MTERETRYFDRVGAAKTPVALAAAFRRGRFGPKTCAKLAADFAAYEPRNADGWNRDAYERLGRMFRLAGGDGAVKFH